MSDTKRGSPISELDSAESIAAIGKMRCGQIIVREGQLLAIKPRRFPIMASVAAVKWQTGWGRRDDAVCKLDFSVPRNLPGYLTLDYIRGGQRGGYRTFRTATRLLDRVAEIKQSAAIVAHVTNSAISDRLLQRLGWQRHCLHWRGRHFIRRLERTHSSRVGSQIEHGGDVSNRRNQTVAIASQNTGGIAGASSPGEVVDSLI